MNNQNVSRRSFVAGAFATAALASIARAQPPGPASAAAATQTYLNTGSLGRSPDAVVNAQFDSIRRIQSDPMSAYGALEAEADAVRAKLAKLLDCGDVE